MSLTYGSGFHRSECMKLECLASIRSGSLHDRAGDEAFFVSAGDVEPFTVRTSALSPGALPGRSAASAALLPHDVLVALRGRSNPAAVVPSRPDGDRPLFATLDLAVVRLGPSIDPDFLAWFINLPSTQDELALDRSGSGIPRLSLPALGSLEVPTPSLDRQRAIAAAAAEAKYGDALGERIRQARWRLLNTFLRDAAEERFATSGNSSRTERRLHGSDPAMQASSNRQDWKDQNA